MKTRRKTPLNQALQNSLTNRSHSDLLSRVVVFNWNSSMQKDKILDELSSQGPQVKGTLRQVRRSPP